MANVYQPIVDRFVNDLEALIQRSIYDVIVGAIGQTSPPSAARSATPAGRNAANNRAGNLRKGATTKRRKAPRLSSDGADRLSPDSGKKASAGAERASTEGAAHAAPVVAARPAEPVPPPRFVRLPPRGKARPQRKREEASVMESPVVAPSSGPVAPIKRVRAS